MTAVTPTKDAPITARSRWNPLWLLLIVVVSVALRVGLVLTEDFPLGDGGFFYQSVVDLQANEFVPPITSSYNLEQLPYVFPPAAFYIVGGLQTITNASLTEIFRWYPVAVSVVAILVFYAFASIGLRGQTEALLATMIFAIVPIGVIPAISGGGVVRATASVSAIAAVHYGNLLGINPRRTLIVPVAVFLALAMLTQFQWGLFALISVIVVYFVRRRSLKATTLIIAALLLAVVLMSSWVLYVDRYHTLEPLANALFNSIDVASPLTPFFSRVTTFTSEPMLGLLAALGILGIFVCAVTKRWLLIVWIGVLLVFPVGLEPLVVPVAFIVAVAINYLIVTGISSFRIPSRIDPATGAVVQASNNWPVVVSVASVILLVVYTAVGIFKSRDVTELLIGLNRFQLSAMEWVSENTPEESRFIVITGLSIDEEDNVTDWFPALTGRSNVAATRSVELLEAAAFEERLERYEELQACVTQRAVCIESIVPSAPVPTYVYLTPTVRGRLRAALLQNDNYDLVYPSTRTRVNETLIFQRLN